ncbi:MFS transporter, partial [Escherichia coli]|uniref:MFS transporter n=1 Tax=Escherichia coli TaxID=562 RepID=UPI0022813D9F
AIITAVMRRDMPETDSYKQASQTKPQTSSLRGLLRYPREVAIVVGLTAGGTAAFYTFTTYMQKYLVNTAGMDAKLASAIMTVALFVFMLLQPAVGAFSDKIGRRSSMLIFSAFATVLTVP